MPPPHCQCLDLFRKIKYPTMRQQLFMISGFEQFFEMGWKNSPQTCVCTACLLWCNAACLDVQSFYSRLHIQDCINSRYNGVAQFQESIAKLLRYVSEYSLIQPNNSVNWGFIRYLIGRYILKTFFQSKEAEYVQNKGWYPLDLKMFHRAWIFQWSLVVTTN